MDITPDRQTTARPRSRPVLIFLASYATMAVAGVIGLYSYGCRVRLELGHWPVGPMDNASPSLDSGSHSLLLGSFLFPLAVLCIPWSALVAWVLWKRPSNVPRPWAWAVLWALLLAILWVDPGGVLDWWVD